MFVQHKQLSVLNIPAKRVLRVQRSTSDTQLALSEFPSQMATAFLVALSSGSKIQIVLGFYLVKSQRSVFFLPQAGEVAAEQAEAVLEEAVEFAEAMGFVLNDLDFQHLPVDQQQKLWQSLPICRRAAPVSPQPAAQPAPVAPAATAKAVQQTKSVAKAQTAPLQQPPAGSLQEKRQRCRESLGRFLASL